MKKITTKQLIALLEMELGGVIEARLCLKHGGYGTHFLDYYEGYLLNEGIDGEEIKETLDEFYASYSTAYWIVDNIADLKQEAIDDCVNIVCGGDNE